MDYEKRVQEAIREIITAGLAESAHDVSDGGLAVAAAECCLGGVGAALHLESDLPSAHLLFHEGPSRILISTANAEAVAQIAARHGVEAPQLGLTMKASLTFGNRGSMLATVTLESIQAAYENALETQLKQ